MGYVRKQGTTGMKSTSKWRRSLFVDWRLYIEEYENKFSSRTTQSDRHSVQLTISNMVTDENLGILPCSGRSVYKFSWSTWGYRYPSTTASVIVHHLSTHMVKSHQLAALMTALRTAPVRVLTFTWKHAQKCDEYQPPPQCNDRWHFKLTTKGFDLVLFSGEGNRSEKRRSNKKNSTLPRSGHERCRLI